MPPSAKVDQECVEGYLFSGPPPQLLLFRRPPSRGSIWVPVSGKVDPGDADLRAALRRELLEETGLSVPRRIEDLEWEFLFRGPAGGTWRLHAFAVETERGFVPTLSDEHVAARWMDPAESLRQLHYADNREAARRLLRRFFPGSVVSEPPNL